MPVAVDAVAHAFSDVLGERLVGMAVHGSAVTGDSFPKLSDVDFVIVLAGRLALDDSAAIAARTDAVDIKPFAYVQATYHEEVKVEPSIVPGAFRLLGGTLDDGFLHTAESLTAAATAWMERVPFLVDGDLKDWSVAVARRPRQLRLILTRLKPTVRATLVVRGEEPIATYRCAWPGLVDRLRGYEPALANDLSTVLSELRAATVDPLALGAQLLGVLARVTALPS